MIRQCRGSRCPYLKPKREGDELRQPLSNNSEDSTVRLKEDRKNTETVVIRQPPVTGNSSWDWFEEDNILTASKRKKPDKCSVPYGIATVARSYMPITPYLICQLPVQVGPSIF